jgi:hypothetical protein
LFPPQDATTAAAPIETTPKTSVRIGFLSKLASRAGEPRRRPPDTLSFERPQKRKKKIAVET